MSFLTRLEKRPVPCRYVHQSNSQWRKWLLLVFIHEPLQCDWTHSPLSSTDNGLCKIFLNRSTQDPNVYKLILCSIAKKLSYPLASCSDICSLTEVTRWGVEVLRDWGCLVIHTDFNIEGLAEQQTKTCPRDVSTVGNRTWLCWIAWPPFVSPLELCLLTHFAWRKLKSQTLRETCRFCYKHRV